MNKEDRLRDLIYFYELLDQLEHKCCGKKSLSESRGTQLWPERGVYFFFENGETRSSSGSRDRVVRVGTHALKSGSRTTLWKRLYQHRGQRNGGGNHRGSIFRLLVGTAIMNSEDLDHPTWGVGSSAPSEIRGQEQYMEKKVSNYLGKMRFLYLSIKDEPGPASIRGFIERNSIALLSNYDKKPVDPPSANWLGYQCDRKKVRESGLWNQNHVDENYDPEFIKVLDNCISGIDV